MTSLPQTQYANYLSFVFLLSSACVFSSKHSVIINSNRLKQTDGYNDTCRKYDNTRKQIYDTKQKQEVALSEFSNPIGIWSVYRLVDFVEPIVADLSGDGT